MLSLIQSVPDNQSILYSKSNNIMITAQEFYQWFSVAWKNHIFY